MCEDCNHEQLYKFENEVRFFQFEKKLQKKRLKNKIFRLDSDKNNSTILLKSKEIDYKCSSCSQLWVLSINEDVMKSFFLTGENASNFKLKLLSKDKKQSNGCLLMLALTVLSFVFFAFYN
jgi:DNA-directed RNA polymerase subunit RPC12/RpoP